MKFKITIFVVSLVAIVLSIVTEIRVIELRRDLQSQFNRLNSTVNEKLETQEKEITNLNRYFEPDGVVEKFIVSNNFLEKI